MLRRREATLEWMSAHVYRVLPLSGERQQIKALFPEETILAIVRPSYAVERGRRSEDPVLLTKIMLLSFFYAVAGDENTLETLRYRMDWRPFCDLPLDAPLPERSTLVTFRRRVGLSVIEGLFEKCLAGLVDREFVDVTHRFFDGTPGKARASINPSREEVYTELFAVIDENLPQFHAQQGALEPSLNTTPVELTKTRYAADRAGVEARRSEEMKAVSDRQSAGDPEARFPRGKHGKRAELGDDVFFSTAGKPLFIEDVPVSAHASDGTSQFWEKLEHRMEGQRWRVAAECAEGEILAKAEANGVRLNTPPRQVSSHGTFPKTEFGYEAETDTYTCPAGQRLSHCGTAQKLGERHYRPEKGPCDRCPLRASCTRSQTGRTVTRNRYEAEWERQRDHARTSEAGMGQVLRGIIAEGKFADAVRHGLKTMRSVGRQMALMQSPLVAFILNVKRFVRLQAQGVIPYKERCSASVVCHEYA